MAKYNLLTNLKHLFGLETSKYFVLNETQYIAVFKNADSEFDNYFLNFVRKYLFRANLVRKLESALS